MWLGATLLVWGTLAVPVQAMPLAPTLAYLPPGNAITDGNALLRYSLPIENKGIRQLQADVEGMSEWLRSKRWSSISKDLKKVTRTLNNKRSAILADVPTDQQAVATTYLDHIQAQFEPMQAAVDNRDSVVIWAKRAEILSDIGKIESLMVAGFPFEVPEEYSYLPQLKGRATVQFETNKGTMTAVIDGYSAPVSGGNFVDLVQRGFYNDMEFIRAEDNYVLQTGDPAGPAEGFVDPKTKQYRSVPLEILVKGDDAPIYGATLESLGRYLDEPVLPFSAFGTLGMARPGDDPNGGSSQFFFFLFEPELTPAGLNLLDGRYSVFGYVVENKQVLEQLGQGDRIVKATVIDGLENLVQPAGA